MIEREKAVKPDEKISAIVENSIGDRTIWQYFIKALQDKEEGLGAIQKRIKEARATGRPGEQRPSLDRDNIGRHLAGFIFEQAAYFWRKDQLPPNQSTFLLSPKETLLFYLRLQPYLPTLDNVFRKSIKEISVPDGLILQPHSKKKGLVIVRGAVEYTAADPKMERIKNKLTDSLEWLKKNMQPLKEFPNRKARVIEFVRQHTAFPNTNSIQFAKKPVMIFVFPKDTYLVEGENNIKVNYFPVTREELGKIVKGIMAILNL